MGQAFTRIYLMRHGEVINPRRAYYGQDDVPLSEQGKRQSIQAAQGLAEAGISVIISSDLSRCRFLADALSEVTGVEARLTAELREVNFGKWTGLTWDEIEEQYPGAFKQRMKDLEGFRPPGGENLSDLQNRITARIRREVSQNPLDTIAVVAHGGANRVFLATMLGMPLSRIFSLDQGHACTNIIDIFADGAAVVRAINLPWYMGKGGLSPAAAPQG